MFLYVLLFGHVQILFPIFWEVVELVGVHHDQNYHGVDDYSEPEGEHHFSPQAERDLRK